MQRKRRAEKQHQDFDTKIRQANSLLDLVIKVLKAIAYLTAIIKLLN